MLWLRGFVVLEKMARSFVLLFNSWNYFVRRISLRPCGPSMSPIVFTSGLDPSFGLACLLVVAELLQATDKYTQRRDILVLDGLPGSYRLQ